jgi:hypothetical protein
MKAEGSITPNSPAKSKGFLENMAPNIALIVLFAYVLLLFLLTIISCVKGSTETQWLELTKTGFTTLGSALTLILGYYFGQKQVAEEAKRETQKTSEELDKEKQKTSQLVANLTANPTASEPDDLSQIDKSQLPKGRPGKAAQT